MRYSRSLPQVSQVLPPQQKPALLSMSSIIMYVVPMEPPLDLVLGLAWQVLRRTTFIISIILEKKRQKKAQVGLEYAQGQLSICSFDSLPYSSLVQTRTYGALFSRQASQPPRSPQCCCSWTTA